MTTTKNTRRTASKLVRKVAKLDRRWRAAGRPEGRLENDLAMHLGRAARQGLYAKTR